MTDDQRSVWPGAALCAALALAGCAPAPVAPEDPQAYRARIEQDRAERDDHYRTTQFNAFGLLDRHYFDDQATLTIGSGPGADLRIEDAAVEPVHAVVRGLGPNPTLEARGRVTGIEDPGREITALELANKTGFKIGRFHLRFNVSVTGRRNVEVYDPAHPNVTGFESLDYYPVQPEYRLTGTIVPADDPPQIEIQDSHGNADSYYLYGELRFPLDGEEQSLELYTRSLDPDRIAQDRFMLVFTDQTSGKETYPAARYLYIEGKARGEVEVDFNMAFNPSCNYSFVYTCPLPRSKNRLKVAIPAGEKWYRKHAVEIQSVGGDSQP